MLTNRSAKLAAIHIAKKQLKLDDRAYRAMLKKTAGVSSAAKIQNDNQYFAVMKAFRRAGWNATGSRSNHCTPAQLYYIKGLWQLASREKTQRSLNAFIKRIAGVEDIRFLSRKNAQSIILALRNIAEKAGYNPDKPGSPNGRL